MNGLTSKGFDIAKLTLFFILNTNKDIQRSKTSIDNKVTSQTYQAS
jgi:hypothetical protein